MPAPLDADDDGLAPERTVLAWNRTGTAFLIAIAALARRVWPIDQGNHVWVLVIVAAAAIAFLVSLWFAGRLRTRARYLGATLDPHAFRLVSAGTFTLAVAGFALALFPA